MTTAHANREGRLLAKHLADAPPEHIEAVLRHTHPMVADACRRHLKGMGK